MTENSPPSVNFTPSLVQLVGNISTVLADFLVQQTEQTQRALEERFSGVPSNATRHVLNAFATLEGTKKPLSKEELDFPDLTDEQVGFCLGKLEKARILREADGVYELSHDTLARHIADQRSAQEVALLEVVKLVEDRYNSFDKTKTFLNEKELQLVDEQTARLRRQKKLNPEQWAFVERSRSKIRNRRRTRITAILGIIVALVAFSAYSQYNVAKIRALEAETQASLLNVQISEREAREARIDADAKAVEADSNAAEARRLQGIANKTSQGLEVALAQARRQKQEADFNLAKLYEERAGVAHRADNYQEAWLYTLEALRQAPPQNRLPLANGRLLMEELRPHEVHRSGGIDLGSRSVWSIDVNQREGALAFGASGRAVYTIDAEGNIIDSLEGKGHPRELTLNVASGDSGPSLAFRSTSPDTLSSGDTIQHLAFRWWPGPGERVDTLRGHTGAIQCLAFQPGKKVLATGAADGGIWLWDEKSQRKGTLMGHTKEVNSLRFSPDGQYLVSGSSDRTVQIWNPETGQLIRQMKGHRAPVRHVLFLGQGAFLASADDDNRIIIWDVRNGVLLHEWEAFTGAVISNLAASPKGALLLSTSGNTLRLWNWRAGEEQPVGEVRTSAVITSLVSSKRENLIFLGTTDKKIRRLSLDLQLFSDDHPVVNLEEYLVANDRTPFQRWLAETHRVSFEKLPYEVEEATLVSTDSRRVAETNESYFGQKAFDFSKLKFIEENLLSYVSQKGSGYPQFNDDQIMLTQDRIEGLGSVCFLNEDISPPFEVSFEYNIDKEPVNSFSWDSKPADGLVLMFLKRKDVYRDTVPTGGARGFLEDGTGYGLHFATFDTNDILLLDGDGTLLGSAYYFTRSWVEPPVYSAGEWRDVRVRVMDQSITVYYNGKVVLTYEGNWEKQYGGLGFGAASGGATARHIVRNVQIKPLTGRGLAGTGE